MLLALRVSKRLLFQIILSFFQQTVFACVNEIRNEVTVVKQSVKETMRTIFLALWYNVLYIRLSHQETISEITRVCVIQLNPAISNLGNSKSPLFWGDTEFLWIYPYFFSHLLSAISNSPLFQTDPCFPRPKIDLKSTLLFWTCWLWWTNRICQK